MTTFRPEPVRNGGVTSPRGFLASGVACGIKRTKKSDLALLVSESPAEVAACFTTNQIKAAPVRVSQKAIKRGRVRGVVVNSGNANACTGVQGLEDAKEMVNLAAAVLDAKPSELLVCSTGPIGEYLPMARVRKGIRAAAEALSARGGSAAARAIMTTDTKPKQVACKLVIDGTEVTIGGMAKGAGMIHPMMATTLGFVTTDASIGTRAWRKALVDAVDQSFNRISIDGDTSTNDTLIGLANGEAGNNRIQSYHPQLAQFTDALNWVTRKLARMVVEDGEKTTKVVEIVVKGARNAKEAYKVAHSVGQSTLVKCAWAGGDPNWGRVMAAIGYSDATIKEELIEIYYEGLLAVCNGHASKTPASKIRQVVEKPSFSVTIHLHSGDGEYSLLTTDLTPGFVRYNMLE